MMPIILRVTAVGELMSSFYIGNSEVSANPSTSQLFMVPYNEKLTLKIKICHLQCLGILSVCV